MFYPYKGTKPNRISQDSLSESPEPHKNNYPFNMWEELMKGKNNLGREQNPQMHVFEP